jgi:ubiquinone/menaquinone biosynthesis C-methylase UbiE
VMDALQPLAFPDDSFDLVHARFLCGCMPTTAWPALLKECVRVTRPGGIIYLTEAENGISTSPACEQIGALCARAMQVAGHSYSPDGRHLGVTPLLGHFLRQAGCQHIQQQAHVIDYSVDTDVQ